MNLDIHALNAEATRRLAAQHVGPIRHEESASMTAKQKLRAELERQTRAFERAGGKVVKADRMAIFPWPSSRDARQLVTIANFAYQNSLTQFEVIAAARRGELNVWMYRGDQCLLRTRAAAWQKARSLAATSSVATA